LPATHYRVDSAAGIPIATEVVKLEPKYPFGHYLLGLLYFDSGDVNHAIPELETAARMSPREAQFQFALGNAYAKAGRKEDAARARAAFRNLGAPKSLQASPPRMAIGLPAWTMLLVRRRRAQKEITRDASAEPEGLPASHGRIVASLGSSAGARTSSISHSSNFVSREEGPLRIGSPSDERYHVASCKRPVS
jgi:Flp pilus assembly protein TadD